MLKALVIFLSLAGAAAAQPNGPVGTWLAEDIAGGGVIDRLQTTLVIAEDGPRIANIGAVALLGASQAALLAQFDLAGFAVSAGSACSSGKMKESIVLKAMNVEPALATSFLRISFGPATSEQNVDAFLTEWRRVAERTAAKAA